MVESVRRKYREVGLLFLLNQSYFYQMKQLYLLILTFFFYHTNGQSIVIQETNIPEHKNSVDKYFESTQTITSTLRKLYSASNLRCLSPTYKLTKDDWITMSDKFLGAFPKNYNFQALVMDRRLLCLI
jgi:hypothetical protein